MGHRNYFNVFKTPVLITLSILILVLFLAYFFVPMASGSISQPTPEEQSRLKEKEAARSKAEEEPEGLSGADWATWAAADIVLLGVAAVAFWLIMFRKADREFPPLDPNKVLLLAGILLLIIGPILLPLGVYLLSAIFPMLLFGFIAFVILGWVLIGAALRPRKSYSKGALLATITYFLIGAGWALNWSLITGHTEAGLASSRHFWTEVLGTSLFWPMQVVYRLEIFGLHFN